ncbi:MAG: uracil-DNA glycosylase [Deltaproteobacteria bacterium]|nr:uracil-DNA glycosylase [Deltaproteobacteria bacterium]
MDPIDCQKAPQVYDVLDDLGGWLTYFKSLGVDTVPKSVTQKQAVSSHETLEDIHQDLGECTRCGLCHGRRHIVFGEGNPKAELMFVGEGPGEEEDKTGRPFVGRAGQLLTKIIEAMKFDRKDVYIANVVKCRPPHNRVPDEKESATCKPFLLRQITTVKPKVIVSLGSVATHYLLETDQKISQLRGKFLDWQGIKIMPTYHPAFLLRNPPMKKVVWEDMQQVMKFFGK